MQNIKTQIESRLGRAVNASKISGVDYQYFDQDAKKFVNITIPDTDLQSVASFVLKNKKLPLQKPDTTMTVFFDYGGANVAKPLHIGHLRPPIIGEALKRVFKAFGHKTISDPHFGDWGLQMGLVLAQLEDEGNNSPNSISLDLLNDLYPKASKRSKDDPEFYQRAADITRQLQQKKQPWYDRWAEIRKTSVTAIMQSYNVLNCTFDVLHGESDAEAYIAPAIEILKKNGATTDNGCLIMEVKTEADNKPMPPVILQKSGGGDLYATTDIATILYRQKTYAPDEYVYVTDFRQELHFEQVFRTVKKGKIVPPDTKFTHVSHGSMNGTDGKPFKTRAGDTIKLADVIQLVTDAASKRMRAPNPHDAQLIGISALKFTDLSNNVRKDYVFDPDRFTAFEGKTGPYLLYTVARINSIQKKVKTASGTCVESLAKPLSKQVSEQARNILRAVVRLTDAYATAIKTYSLNAIVDAAFDLATQFNLLYANENIQKSDDNLTIAALVKTSLLIALDTLAITPVDEM